MMLLISFQVHADDSSGRNWGLENIDSEKAWRITKGNKKVTVAVIDTGVDVTHPDLSQSLWVNEGESGRDNLGRDKATNGLDDDGNGFIDDFHGWNFSSNTNDLTDKHGHGTHIAGIIAGNGKNFQGVAPGVKLMILKYYDPEATGENNLEASIRAIDYAIQMKADIINYSGGGPEASPREKAAIARAQKAGILVVAAAGNEKSNSDYKKFYPANYGFSNIISVTAIDQEQKILSSSNYGTQSVDMAAPGKSIYSTLPGGYGRMTGTSQATAFVTGAAALLMSERPSLKSPEQVIRALVKTGDKDFHLNGKTKYQVRLNSYKALAMQDESTDAFGQPQKPALKNDKYFLSDYIATRDDSTP
jgi:subtilisin family serine protease